MTNQFIRTEMLIGGKAVEKLAKSNIAVFGVGGVGGFVAEAAARAGIGHITLIDNDTVSLSNINRQIIALHSTIGRYKTEVMKERILDINPNAEVNIINCFYLPENKDIIDFSSFDYIIDAVDTVTAKLTVIEEAKKAGVPVLASVAAIFLPIRPDLPMPVTTTLPVQARIARTAPSKSSVSRVASRLTASASA